jgi:hypothetical protein
MKRTYLDLPHWEFNIEEVSAGVYRVDAMSTQGHKVSKTGIDVNELINECKFEAKEINIKNDM